MGTESSADIRAFLKVRPDGERRGRGTMGGWKLETDTIPDRVAVTLEATDQRPTGVQDGSGAEQGGGRRKVHRWATAGIRGEEKGKDAATYERLQSIARQGGPSFLQRLFDMRSVTRITHSDTLGGRDSAQVQA